MERRSTAHHINAVDAVTQWQVVGCAEKISELYLVVLAQFPFQIRGFHADNGSEYINHRVAEMLRKLHAEFTKSRACQSQDNALVEGKNGAVIRKLIGYGHIADQHAEAFQKFYREHLNPYLNCHRPRAFATLSLDERGKRQRTYKLKDYRTPLEKLQSLPQAEQYLKPAVSTPDLEKRALAISDTEYAVRMNVAKTKLLRQCKSSPCRSSPKAATGRGKTGPVESVENQKLVSHSFRRPLKISQRRRDVYISTAPAWATRPTR